MRFGKRDRGHNQKDMHLQVRELSISHVLFCQVDGGDQESHQLSSQVEPPASKE